MSPLRTSCRVLALLAFTPFLFFCTDDKQGDGAPIDTIAPALSDGGATTDLQPLEVSTQAGTGGQGGELGHTSQTLDYGGEARLFAVHVPPSYDAQTPTALLLHFHGWRPLPAEVNSELAYVWGDTADENGFIAVAPEGLPCPELNPDDPYGCFRELRDGPFVTALIEHLGGLYNLDLKRVYLSGHSGGAFFVQGHGIAHADTYASTVTFSGGCISSSDQYGNSCSVYQSLSAKASRKIPFFVVHHGSDQVVPIRYSVDLLDVLKAGEHPTSALDQYDPPGEYGHSIDVKIVPQVWEWVGAFTLP
ncbi:MAG: hypothetical protein JRH20_27555 [Deltaproteobacteria bacterium]|nr:hypothetical protein [Deltaproteobacteria bacterium]